LDVQNVLRSRKGADVEVGVVLKWNADEVGHWILRGFLQGLRGIVLGGRCGGNVFVGVLTRGAYCEQQGKYDCKPLSLQLDKCFHVNSSPSQIL
jgi:hypothetical protein